VKVGARIQIEGRGLQRWFPRLAVPQRVRGGK
jgi:hypothetical protein